MYPKGAYSVRMIRHSLFAAAVTLILACTTAPADANTALLIIERGESKGQCTAFAFEIPGIWATAKHCMKEDAKLTISGHIVTVAWEHPKADVMLLRGPQARPFHLAGGHLDIMDRVHYTGWMPVDGKMTRVTLVGTLAAQNHLPASPNWMVETDLYQAGGAPGMSGSAMLDDNNEVVGMILGGRTVLLMSASWKVMVELSRAAKRLQ